MSGWIALWTAGHRGRARFKATNSLSPVVCIALAAVLILAGWIPSAAAQGTTPTPSPISVPGATTPDAKPIPHAASHPNPTAAPTSPALTSTTSLLTVSSGVDPYNVTCGVTGAALTGVSGPTGTVTFADTTTGTNLGTASLGTATQGLDFALSYPAPPANSSGVFFSEAAVGDFNGDGIPDLILPIQYGQTLEVLLGDGHGGFGTSLVVPVSSILPELPVQPYLGGLVVGDFNGDGKLDVAMVDGVPIDLKTQDNYLAVLFGNGDGTFQATGQSFFLGVKGYQFVPGDFNGDGYTDLVSLGKNGGPVFLGSTSGLVQSSNSVTSGSGTLDGGGVVGVFTGTALDLAIVYADGIAFVQGNGDGTFQAPVYQSMPFAPNPYPIAMADFNRDGKLDLALSGGTPSGVGGTWILFGNGDGTFQIPGAPASTAGGDFQGIGDFNGDGIPDIEAGTAILLGNGNGTFQMPGPFNAPTGLIADFNGDGRADIVSSGGLYLNYTAALAVSSETPVTVTPGTASQHTLECTYPGDSNYAGSVSNAITETYTQGPTPIFSLNVGNYATAQTVSISDTTVGPIYYTTDGSTPTASSTLYTAPITVSTTETLKAIAAPIRFTISPVSEAVYTITDPPSLSVPGGTYSTQQSVALSDATSGAVIYYTTDGSTPGKTSKQYTTPITIIGDVTLKTIALASGNLFSPLVTATYSVPKEATTTAIQSSTLNADENQKITLSATVTGLNPTGKVTFATGSQNLGTASLSGGVASLQVSFARAGSYSVTAAYGGDSANGASTSSSVTVVIATPTFAVASSPSSQTVSAGQSASYAFTVTPANGYTGTVNLSCGTLPSEASCSFSASSLTITGSGTGKSTLTISTTAPTVSRNTAPASPFAPWRTGGGIALAGILGLALAPNKVRRWNRRFRALVCVLLLGALWLPLVGCGGGGGMTTKTGGTPAGTYTVTVTAADSAGGGSTTAKVTLIVQ